jgi:hypothetical protein
LINSNAEIINYLESSMTTEEIGILNQSLKSMEAFAFDAQAVPGGRWREFSIRRMLGSSSLGLGKEIDKERWDQLNTYIHTKIQDSTPLCLKEIQNNNSILVPKESGNFRKSYSSGGEKTFVDPGDIEFFLNKLERYLEESRDDHPLWRAFIIYSWGITVHPFSDANGRTFRGACDWVLMASGILPVSFSSSVSAHVAVARNVELPVRSKVFASFIQGVLNSYQFLSALD